MFHAAIGQMAQMLTNLASFLEEGAAFAEEKGFDVAHLLTARLAPDMFSLTRQVQAAADLAKFAAARLAGVEAPSDPDDETTLAELQARLKKTIEYVRSFEPSAFEGAAERKVKLAFLPLPARGHDYLLQFAQPNFYFHVTTAYAILRHNGVALGKRKFIGRFDLIEA